MRPRLAGAVDTLRRKISLQARTAILLAVAILPVGAISVWQAMTSANETTRLEETFLIDRTRRAAEDERVVVTTVLGALKGLESFAAVLTLPNAECPEALAQFVQTDPRFAVAAFVLEDGTIACASPADAVGAPYDRLVSQWEPLLQTVRRTAISSGSPVFDGSLLSLSRPVFRGGNRVGTLLVAVPVSLLNTITRADDDPDFRLAIVDWQGQKASDDTPITQDPDWWPENLVLPAAEVLTEHLIVQNSVAGRPRVYAIVPIIPGDMFAVGSWRQDTLKKDARRRKALAVLFPVTMWILALAVSYATVYRLAVRNIEYLRRIMRAFENGRRLVRARQLLSASPEFVELGQAFNRMADTIERDEADLEHSVEEKNTLLREVHHRVKNNLQLVISMMNMQLRDAQGDAGREAILNVQNRVMSLATVHQRLYQAGDLTAVRCDDLISDIVKNLVASDPRADDVSVQCDLLPLHLSSDRAIPLALIATESIINALKYGTDTHNALLTVKMAEVEDGQVSLEIRNAAIDPDLRENGGMGMKLKQAFARQLRGTIERSVESGVYRLSLVFPKDESD